MVRCRNKKCSETGPKRRCSGSDGISTRSGTISMYYFTIVFSANSDMCVHFMHNRNWNVFHYITLNPTLWVDRLFRDGNINWGRIVTLLCFGYRMAVTVIQRGIRGFFSQIVGFVVRFVLSERIARWIADQGGWVSNEFLSYALHCMWTCLLLLQCILCSIYIWECPISHYVKGEKTLQWPTRSFYVLLTYHDLRSLG